MKKKALIVNTSIDHGGMGEYTLSLINILHSLGYKCTLLLTHGRGSIIDLVPKQCRVVSLEGKGLISRYIGMLVNTLRISPDIVFCNYNAAYHRITPFLPSKTKIVHVIHSNESRFYKAAAINPRSTTAWIAPSPAVRDRFVTTYPNLSDRIHVLPHGVSEYNVERVPLESGTIRLIFIGTLFQYKGVDILPTVAKILVERGIPFSLDIVGAGDLDGWLRTEFAEDIETGRVRMLGNLPHNQIYSLLGASDCLIFPSWLESFGLVITEAMMCGVIPIVNIIPGVTDFIVEDGKCGFILNRKNPEEFADCIQHLYENRQIMHEMSQSAQKRALDMFSIRCMKSNYKNFLSQLS